MIRAVSLGVAASFVLFLQPAHALVVCAKADKNTGQAKENAKLVLRTACRADKEVPIGIETSGVPGTDGLVRFNGVNVQVVSGSGATGGAVNGLGNVLVGYNERSTGGGSHNLVVGSEHTYPSYGGLLGGIHNTTNGPNASVTGGFNNVASGASSSVSGGLNNTVLGNNSSITGGEGNAASGDANSITGGQFNGTSGPWSSVTGGTNNRALVDHASVSGGNSNTASGFGSSVSGGAVRMATGDTDWWGGGLFQDQ